MRWEKKGLIFNSDGKKEWSISHAQVPKADPVDNERLRIYYGTRDSENRTRTSYIEVSLKDPGKILYIHNDHLLELGRMGTFDDCGVMPSSIVNYNNVKYLYYTGWNTDIKVPYKLAIGLARSFDGGVSFEKVSEGPVIDRSINEPISVCQPFVIIDKGIWKMWYSSFTKWGEMNGRLEPFYNIKYAESEDGVNWELMNLTCIDYDEESDALGNPFVWVDNGLYRMLYSYRKNINYRSNKNFSYRIGYAESNDGLKWAKVKDRMGLNISDEGWDSEMTAYPNLYDYDGRKYLLYNGNGFGKTGFGYAVLENGN